ncbi:hypothetical protein [Rubrivirga sp.]|uniref:hypothetical protein n=1 Tax=Rubrivirga sp. TaxID=1885344 RepID=UPI003C734743
MRALLLGSVLVFAAGCGSAPPLYSTSDPAETTVDGSADEWPRALRPVPDESGLSIGLRLEDDDLVVALIAADGRQSRRIALGGLRVWVDPMGGDDRVLGVRYPAPGDPSRSDIAQRGPRPGGRDGQDPTRLRRRFEAGLTQAELTRGVVTQQISPDGDAGIEAAAMWGPQTMVIEMRIPLGAEDGLLDLPAGQEIGVGIELLDVQRPQPSAPNARTSGRGLPPGRRPTGDQARERVFEPSTLTRWLRISRVAEGT